MTKPSNFDGIPIGKFLSYFRSCFELHTTTNEWRSFDCPFCGGVKKQAVRFDYNSVKCFKCESRFNLLGFVRAYEGCSYQQARKLVSAYSESFIDVFAVVESLKPTRTEPTVSKLPYGFTPILDGSTHYAKLARKYLQNRGQDLDYLSELGFGYVDSSDENHANYFGYIIIPFQVNGQFIYFNARNFVGDEPRYKNPTAVDFGIGKAEILWNEDALTTKRRVFLMEGVFSALAALEEGVGLGGKSMSLVQQTKIIKGNAEEIVICLDSGYNKEAFNIAYKLLPYKKVKVLKLPDEFGDPDDAGTDVIIDLYKSSDFVSDSSIFDVIFD